MKTKKTKVKKQRKSDAVKVEEATNALVKVLRDVRGRRGRDFIRKQRFGETLDELDAKFNAKVELHFPGDQPLELKVVPDEPARRTIWEEDDATCHSPGHEGLAEAYLRFFGEELDVKAAVHEEDGGDGIEYFMPNGAIVWSSYPGGSTIEALAEYDDTPAYGIAWRIERIREAPPQGRSLLREIHGRMNEGWQYLDVTKNGVKGRIHRTLLFVVRERKAFGKCGEDIAKYASIYKMVADGWVLAKGGR
jgi:hypothetical protein